MNNEEPPEGIPAPDRRGWRLYLVIGLGGGWG